MLKSNLVYLRPLEKSDLGFLHELHNNYRTMNYLFEESYETLRELEDIYERHVHSQSERRFIIVDNHSDENVGVLSLTEIDQINQSCAVDIIVGDNFRGQGYGKHGFVLGTKYAFDVLNLFKVYLYVLVDNHVGQHIYQSCGFKRECKLKKEFFVDGHWVDILRMCMFRGQWRRHKRRLREEFGFDATPPSRLQDVAEVQVGKPRKAGISAAN